MSTQSVSFLKQRVTGVKAKGSDPTLALAEHDGLMWATNRYWLTPAARLAPLLEQFNLDPAQPGMFEVNSTVRKRSSDTPRIAHLIGKPEDYPVTAEPVLAGGHRAHVRLSDKADWLAVYSADGAVFGLPAEDLAWLSDLSGMQLTYPRPFELGPDEHHFGEPRVMVKGGGTIAPAVIVAEVFRRDPDTRQESVSRTLIIGLLMPVKLDG